jgi:hypothetical protein
VFGGWVEHHVGCPLGDRVAKLNARGVVPGLLSEALPADASEPEDHVGASQEVVHHAIRLHARECPFEGYVESVCPCGAALVLACKTCGGPVMLMVTPGDWCEHAEEFQSTSRDRWGSRREGS